jgi:hypothetical protein
MRTKDGKRVWSSEIWAMFQTKPKSKNQRPKILGLQKIRIISAWRFPGVSPKRDPIPADILRELKI